MMFSMFSIIILKIRTKHDLRLIIKILLLRNSSKLRKICQNILFVNSFAPWSVHPGIVIFSTNSYSSPLGYSKQLNCKLEHSKLLKT